MKNTTMLKLSELGLGDKFIYDDQLYLRIDMDPSHLFKAAKVDNVLVALNLDTYRVMSFIGEFVVELRPGTISI